MNPRRYRVSQDRWEEFQKHYAWQKLQTPDYRLGQAFLNYFPEVDQLIQADSDLGVQDSVALYYEYDDVRAMNVIITWLDQ